MDIPGERSRRAEIADIGITVVIVLSSLIFIGTGTFLIIYVKGISPEAGILWGVLLISVGGFLLIVTAVHFLLYCCNESYRNDENRALRRNNYQNIAPDPIIGLPSIL